MRQISIEGGTMKKVTLIVITLLLLVSTGLAQRGGGERPPGGGGGGGGGGNNPPANPEIAYVIDGGNANLIAVMNADGSNQTQVYSGSNGNFFTPSWSPLGSGTQLDPYSIAFECCGGLWRIDVAVVNGVPQGSNEIILLSGDYFNPAWSPAGDEIAVDGYATGIFVVPAGGGAAQTLYTPPAGRLARYPTWSPDASQIAFVEQDESGGTNNVITILDRDTGTVLNTLPLGQQFLSVTHLDWSRGVNRNALAFTAGGVYTLDLPSGSPSFVISGGSPSWSPDDTKLAFKGSGRQAGVQVITLATGAVQTLKKGGLLPDWRR
jgi:Tol biopolymer transport system component